MLAADGVLGGTFTPHCARVHPARLVRGLARVVEASGCDLRADDGRSIEPGRVHTAAGVVRAEVVLRATEGYTAGLPGRAPHGRAGLLPDGGHRAARRGDLGLHRARRTGRRSATAGT